MTQFFRDRCDKPTVDSLLSLPMGSLLVVIAVWLGPLDLGCIGLGSPLCRGQQVESLEQQTSPQQTSPQQTSPQQSEFGLGVTIGIQGHYRVGRITPVRLSKQVGANLVESEVKPEQLLMETLDGDGVRVAFGSFPDSVLSNERDSEIGYVVPGSEAAPLSVKVVKDQGVETIVSTRFPIAGIPSQGPAMIPSTMPWVIAIGDALGVEGIGLSNVLTEKTGRIAVTRITRAEDLPFQSLGYDGVNLVMINSSGRKVLQGMSPSQRGALVEWLQGGGQIFVCLGESADSINQSAPWLIELLPLEQFEIESYDPAALETYTTSQTPLERFRGIRLPRRTGRPSVLGRTTRRVSAVLAADYTVGLGRATVVAADLDDSQFASWPERLDLVTRLVGRVLADSDENQDMIERSTAFSDLSGQMRGVLDQFPVKSAFSFSLISLIVMISIAAIGPLDYLLINRVLGKPLLGWLSFPIIAIGLSCVLVGQAAPRLGPDHDRDHDLIRANQFQVTDVDFVGGVGRGFAWSSVYSHDPLRADIHYAGSEDFQSLQSGQVDRSKVFSFPMGYPGREFGGVQLAGESRALAAYSIEQESRSAAESSESIPQAAGRQAKIQGVTIAPRSSKSIAAVVQFQPITSDFTLTRRPGSELLRGKFVNPFPVDVLDGVLVYGNWVYRLPTRVPAGAELPSLGDLRQNNFRWRLTRKDSVDDTAALTTEWEPSDFGDLARVGEMMLFHQAAGGQIYTGLRHDALGVLDLSDVLVEDRCILVGRTERPLYDLTLHPQSDPPSDLVHPEGQILSVIRAVLPVRSTRISN